jgi:exodeoxyribonuclease V gamma subunit
MKLHRSNRLEALADVLAGLVSSPAGDVLAPEHLVVQSKGMAQWVSLALGERLGVAAWLRVHRPRELVERVFRDVLGEEGLRLDAWSRSRIAWALMELLPTLWDGPEFAPLAAYLAQGGEGRRLQLARRIAYVFDQYAVYRPELVLGWQAGEGEGWQPPLWRALVEHLGGDHVAGVARRYERVVLGGEPARRPPARLCLFGISTLPPLYVHVLVGLTRWTEVHVLQLTPSREYWADIRNQHEILRLLRDRDPSFGEEAERLMHLDRGNPLLAAMGRVGREFQAVLLDATEYEEDDNDRFVEPGEQSLLRQLQADLLALRYRGKGEVERGVVQVSDGSVQVHGCHSPMREVEVLRDRLLDLLEADPDLEPRDILVMTPDITVHGPMVEAVFSGEADDPLRLPFTVVDQPLVSGNDVARAVLALLGLVGSRVAVSAVLDLLALAPVRERYGVLEEELPLVRRLIGEAGVRWGWDAADRVAVGQPDDGQNTWLFGLDRLLLGYTMGGEQLVQGRLPLDEVEGGAAELLGRVLGFVRALFRQLTELKAPRSVQAWSADLLAVVDDLLGERPEAFEAAQTLRDRVVAMADDAAAARWTGEVPLEAIRALLTEELAEERRPGGFLKAGVTVCELLPMRAIPFKVVCLLGMSDGVFPRADVRIGFDLIAQHPRGGDRSRRDDDRYMFLEAVLSARDTLLISYVSNSSKDNAELPPSVVVSELLDALDEGFELAEVVDGRETVRSHVLHHHPLQPFGEAYVDPNSRLFTFDREAAGGAAAWIAGPAGEPPFLEQPVGPPPVEVEEVALESLLRFWDDPVAWFHRRRLGIDVMSEAVALDDREPHAPDGLAVWQLCERALRLRMAGRSPEATRAVLRAEGGLPLGALAAPTLRKVEERVEAVLGAAASALMLPQRDPVGVSVPLGPVRLVGRVARLYGPAQVEVTTTNAKNRPGQVRLRLWIRHLAARAGAEGVERAELYARSGEQVEVVRYDEAVGAADARAHLERLVALYRLGQQEPLRFHPDAAHAWGLASEEAREEKAGKVFAGQFSGATGFGAEAKVEPAARERAAVWRRLLGGVEATMQEASPFGGAAPSFAELVELVLRPALDAEVGR